MRVTIYFDNILIGVFVMAKKIAILVLFIYSSNAYSFSPREDIWTIYEEVDEFADKENVNAVVIAEGGLDNGFVSVSCMGGNFVYKVSTGRWVGGGLKDNFMYRIDDQEAVKDTRGASADYVFGTSLRWAPFIQDIIAGGEFVLVQVTSRNYQTSRARFSLNGASEIINKVIEKCKE